jgi:uncharacterized protein (DUF885 family)
MARFSTLARGAVALLIALTAGCNAPPPPTPPTAAVAQGAAADRLRHVVERYWDDNAARNPWYAWFGTGVYFAASPGGGIAAQVLADSLASERRALADLSAVPLAGLDAEGTLTYELFRRQRVLAIEGFTYPFELLPVNPYEGVPLQFAAAAGAAERLALANPENLAEWRARALEFSRWSAEAIVNMREGLRRGYTLPRPVVEELLPQLADLGLDSDANVFYQPLKSKPETLPLTAVIRNSILPAYRSLHDFLKTEYLPRARTTLALSALPLGNAWYMYLVRRETGGTRSPEELHTLGLEEVDRLQKRVNALLGESGFAGDSSSFASHMRHDARYSYDNAAALLGAAEDLKLRIAGAAPAFFDSLPKADFAIRPADSYFDRVGQPLFYRARGRQGAIGAVLYIDTADLESRPFIDLTADYLSAAVPGHHLQTEMQRERTDLPEFRRFGFDPEFSDGWALYAVTLGEEMGLYESAESKYGELRAQLACALGLVVDTGLQAGGWTREYAIDYVQTLLPGDGAAATHTVDRVIALPGRALGCALGAMRIQALRSTVQHGMGSHFDVRAFHRELLRSGAMPMDLVELSMKAWMKQAEAAAIAEESAARAAEAQGGEPPASSAGGMDAAPKVD